MGKTADWWGTRWWPFDRRFDWGSYRIQATRAWKAWTWSTTNQVRFLCDRMCSFVQYNHTGQSGLGSYLISVPLCKSYLWLLVNVDWELIKYKVPLPIRRPFAEEHGNRLVLFVPCLIPKFRTWSLAAMLMETFDRLSRKEKYVWDVSGSVCLFFLPCSNLGETRCLVM